MTEGMRNGWPVFVVKGEYLEGKQQDESVKVYMFAE